MSLKFPENFNWGAATAAFQIEGHPEEYKQKLSDWSKWIDEKDSNGNSKVLEPSNKGRAVDHWNHYKEDIEQLKKMNCNSYRFSFNWAAIHRGPDDFDQKTLDFYKKLLDELEKHSIKPFATLVHFVLPTWISETGGWENPESAAQFQKFTKKLVDEFGDRIQSWITHNEPNIFLNFGYESGIWPPGYQNEWDRYLKAYQGILLSHQMAYKTIKKANPKAQVGFAQNMYDFQTLSEIKKPSAGDPVKQGIDNTPVTIRRQLHNLAHVQDCMDLGCLDFLGINYYTRLICGYKVDANDCANPTIKSNFWAEVIDPKKALGPDANVNDLNWEVYPEGLFNVLTDEKLKRVIKDIPVYITENGYCKVEGGNPGAAYSEFDFKETGELDIKDDYRIDFIKGHLEAVHKAIESGANVQGYFYWSLLDNFEWALGMKPKFGLIHVDHETMKRSPKESSFFYGEVCKSNQIP